MAIRLSALARLFLLLLLLSARIGSSSGGLDGNSGSGFDLAAGRRLLQASGGYISYGALQRDSVPCSQRGASYYNCRPGGQANPYDRGCAAITQCR